MLNVVFLYDKENLSLPAAFEGVHFAIYMMLHVDFIPTMKEPFHFIPVKFIWWNLLISFDVIYKLHLIQIVFIKCPWMKSKHQSIHKNAMIRMGVHVLNETIVISWF